MGYQGKGDIHTEPELTPIHTKLIPEEALPYFNAFKYGSEGEKSVYRVKNLTEGERQPCFLQSKKLFAKFQAGSSLQVHELTRYCHTPSI